MAENPTETSYTKTPVSRSIASIVLLSLLCPGLGHIYAGGMKRGIIVYFLFYVSTILLIYIGMFISPAQFLLQILQYLLVVLDGIKYSKSHRLFNLKIYNKWYIYIMIYITSALLLTPIIRSIVFDTFVIRTGSMENTILVGDYVIADKSSYGLHIPFSDKYLLKYSEPHRGDLIVFNRTDVIDKNNSDEAKYISRCVGIPGDSLQIKNREVFCSGILYPNPPSLKYLAPVAPENYFDSNIFPKGFKWNKDFYGPLYVPKAGDTIAINFSNYEIWKQVVEFDGHKSEMKDNDKIYIDDRLIVDGKYKVGYNYYFILGDNRDAALDSRYKGFVPEYKIVGRATSIYWSWNSQLPMVRLPAKIASIRWNRIGLKFD